MGTPAVTGVGNTFPSYPSATVYPTPVWPRRTESGGTGIVRNSNYGTRGRDPSSQTVKKRNRIRVSLMFLTLT